MYTTSTRSTLALVPALPALPPSAPVLQFHVSLNEEHVFLQLLPESGPSIDLGERVHHYCLLTLARLRLCDDERGIDPSAQGWIAVDQLAKMLGLDQPHLNIQVHRARQHVASALASHPGMPALLERRRGEIRLGALPFRIVRGARLEAEFTPSPLPSWLGRAA